MKNVQFVCPVSKKKHRGEEHQDVETQHVANEPVGVPIGWGRLTLDVAALNPEVAKVEAQRLIERNKALEDLKKVTEDKRAPQHYRDRAQEQIDNPTDVDLAIAVQLPLPEVDVIWHRVTYPVLSDEALAALNAALLGLGFPAGVE